MITQPSLFDRVATPVTRRGAAPDLDEVPPHQVVSSPAKRNADRRTVLGWYLDHTGTAYECARGLKMLPTTALPRVTDLKNDKCLTRIVGVPRRPTGFGGTATVLIVTAAGRREWQSGVVVSMRKQKGAGV